VKYGYIGRAGCVGFATENTHGCEVTTVAGIENVGKLLAGFVMGEGHKPKAARKAARKKAK